jgi:hypothetical protein
VEVGQQSVRLHLGDPSRTVEIGLQWLQRYGGIFGPQSSAEAASRRFRNSTERFMMEDDPVPEQRHADRGQLPAWITFLSCPTCGKRCTVLRTPRGRNAWTCWKCLPQLAPRNPQPGDPSSQKQAHRQRYWATRIRRDYMGFPPNVAGDLFFRPAICLQRPRSCRITHERWEALRRLAAAHETLWQLDELESIPSALWRLPGVQGALTPTTADRKKRQDATRWAWAVIRMDRWSLRQTSWHRRGRPRNPHEDHPRHSGGACEGAKAA